MTHTGKARGTVGVLDRLHGGYVHSRRVRVLAHEVAQLVPSGSSVLDVGCGDGWIASVVRDQVPSVKIRGIDTLVRDGAHVPVEPFDGTTIPYGDATFDIVMFVDVLHHTPDPMVLLREAARVARRAVVIKDHLLEGVLAGRTLQPMDWVGNARHGVVLPYNYWSREQWTRAFADLGLTATAWKTDIRLYWPVVNSVFGRSLHYVARLEKRPHG